MDRKANFRAQTMKDEGEKVIFDLLFPGGEKLTFSLPFPGLFNVYNVLAASAVGYILNLPSQKIKEAVESFSAPPLHYKIERWKGYTIFNDCYNANPESVKSALFTLKKLKGKRKIAVLGDMLELGKVSPELHQEIGKTAASLGIDALFAWGRFAPYTAIGARQAGLKESFSFEDKETLAKRLVTYLSSGDCLLIKGSRETRMEELIQRLKEGE
jgi:UDP-N-acetylmuramoyl-tripeptide--D-alanyl-D-alanine ligase